MLDSTAYLGFAALFVLLAIVMGGFALWGYRRRNTFGREWWTPLIQVVAYGLFAAHCLLLAREGPGPESAAARATLWYGFASLWCWGITTVGLWMRDRRRGGRADGATTRRNR